MVLKQASIAEGKLLGTRANLGHPHGFPSMSLILSKASEMMKTKPVLHRVVKGRGLAAEYIDEILNIDGLIVQVMGMSSSMDGASHVISNGRD